MHILFLKILFETIYIELMFDYNGNILKIYQGALTVLDRGLVNEKF